jgi:hypothetical protein
MPHSVLLVPASLVLLCTLLGCGTIEKDKRVNAMDAALSTYGEAIRWGYFETAYGYLHPDRRRPVPKQLQNVRVTGYEVMQNPLMKDKTNAEQLVRIEYVLDDEQRVRTLTDRQLWRFDEKAKAWWLHSGVPDFR